MSAIFYPRLVRAAKGAAHIRLCVAHKSKLARTKQPSEYAMEHFDAFYGKVFGLDTWKSVRIALLSKKKYCAVVNPWAVSEELIGRMRSLGCREVVGRQSTEADSVPPLAVEMADTPPAVPDMNPQEETLCSFDDSARLIQKDSTEPLLSFVPATEMVYREEVIDEGEYFNFFKPEEDSEVAMKTRQMFPSLPLFIYAFPPGNINDFPPPKKQQSGLFEYYLMDAASLLPVIALNMKPNEDFADFCAAPGGKTLAVAFTQNTHISPSRVRRLKRILESYIPPEEREKMLVKHVDMTRLRDDQTYDKILVDVPCSNDRLSLEEEESNIFHPTRMRDRLAIPELQKTILTHALRRLRVGGAAVYSTCSLSPVQNDSVVHMTLQSFKQMKFVVTDLTDTFAPFKAQKLFRLYDKCRYGQLVLPYLPNNFGPMYICRIERLQ